MRYTFEHKCAIISYETIGRGFPVVHLHGYELDSTCMKYWFEPSFKKHKGYKRIYIDLPGMGNSLAKPELLNAEDMLEAVLACIRHILPAEPFALIGLSYGSYLGLRVAETSVTQVTKALFVVPVVKALYANRTLPAFRIGYQDTEFITSLSPEEFNDIKDWMVIQTETTFQRTQTEIQPTLQRGQKDFLQHFAASGYAFQDEAEFLSTPLETQMLLVCGKEDIVVGYQDAVNYTVICPNADLVLLANAGHNLAIEQTDKFDLIVSGWLGKHKTNPKPTQKRT